MNETTARLGLGAAVPAASVAAILLPYVALRSDLPERVASHFDGSGTPDRSMTPGMLILTTLVMAGIGIAACIWLALPRTRVTAHVAATVSFLGCFFAGMAAGIAIATVVGQRDIEHWQAASDAWWVVVSVVGLGLVFGATGAALSRCLPHQEETGRPGAAPIMDLDAGQHAVWTQTVRSRWMSLVALAIVVLGILLASWSSWWTAVVAVVAAVVVVSLSTVRVRADRTGLNLRFGWLPWPGVSIGIDEIRSAEVLDVVPSEWGGWGYRGSLKLMKQAALVHRAGPGIRLELDRGRVFVVTVDEPEPAVALLNAEVRRHQLAAS